MEPTALGRAEWMRLFGLLFDCEEQANELFSQVEKHYLSLCDSVKNVSQRPRVMTDMMNGSTWYMPGGGSYLGNLLKDAGADYVLAHDKRSGSVPLSFESVFAMAAEADLWLIKQARNHRPTYAELKNEHATYASFRPWKERTIYFCNTLSTDIYERIPFHPDVLLKELIYLFHPESINTPHEAVYYLPLE
jgi:iron complex transport system substrate-binding protein